ncbi:MAG: ABC transporter ATP-binding protein [Anaerolineales bacterium]|jgi:lipopolysaccharide transport system ATP-binding protein
MNNTVISVENLSKTYRLGQIGTGRLADDLQVWWARKRGKSNPLLKVGETDHGNREGEILWALKDVSFTVEKGEALGIIGRNGAGKSTLLKILSQVTAPSSGLVKIKGRIASLLEVGTGFHPDLTGRDNIYLNGAILGMTKEEVSHKFDEIVDFSGIERFIDTPVKRYSSGMYVRLAFAVAAHLEPEILVVDEVLAVGDADFQKKCLGKMGDVTKGGRTVLYVSHNMASILNLCERTILLERGHFSMSGITNKVISHYLMQGSVSDGEVVISPEAGGLTDDFYFCMIRSLKPGNGVTDQIPLTSGVEIEIVYKVKRALKGANVVIHLFNDMGTCILSSTDVDHDPSLATQVRNPGQYRTRCYIPPDYLRSGRYYIGVSSSIPNVIVLANLPQVIAFDVVDTGSVDSRTGQGRSGVIAPILEWRIQEVIS